MAPSSIHPTKAGERETRGGAPMISALLGAAIFASLPALSAAPAAAAGFNLSPFTYQYIITNASGQIISPPASREPIDITDQPLGQFKERYGTISGDFAVVANSAYEQVDASFTYVPGPTGPGAPPLGGGSIGLTASTNFQLRIDDEPGAKPPEDINEIPIVGMAKGSTACVSPGVHHGAAGAHVNITATLAPGRLIPPVFGAHAGSDCGYGDKGPAKFATTPLTTWWYFPPNRTVSVTASVGGLLSAGSMDEPVSSSFYAFLDPTFEIDPSWAYAKDFQLEISPGGAGSAVPEAPTWATMLLGFVGLSYVAFRHRNGGARSRALLEP